MLWCVVVVVDVEGSLFRMTMSLFATLHYEGMMQVRACIESLDDIASHILRNPFH